MENNLRVLVLYNDPDLPGSGSQTVVTSNGRMETKSSTGDALQTYQSAAVDTSGEGLASEVEAICGSLEYAGFSVSSLNLKNDAELLTDTLRERGMDVIFNLVESFHNESEPEMYVAGLYDLYKIPYTGAGPKALGNCLDKILTKRLLRSNGIRVPRHTVINSLPLKKPIGIPYPLIVKPVHEDASAGIENDSVVYNRKQLLARIEYIHRWFKQGALIEEFINGREFNVSVIGNDPAITLPVSEIDFTGMPDHLHNIVSYQAKWMPDHDAYKHTRPVCPAHISPHTSHELSRTAMICTRIMGTRDYARVDMRVRDDGTVYVLEVNPNPDISRDAGLMRASSAYGWNHAETLKRIVHFAYERR
jgi:D-alanine-D-alanine ligase